MQRTRGKNALQSNGRLFDALPLVAPRALVDGDGDDVLFYSFSPVLRFFSLSRSPLHSMQHLACPAKQRCFFSLPVPPGFFAVPLPFFVKRPTTRTTKTRTTTTQCNNTLFSLIIIIIIIGIPRAEATSISSCEQTRLHDACSHMVHFARSPLSEVVSREKTSVSSTVETCAVVVLLTIDLEQVIVVERVAENAPTDMMMIMRRNCFLLRLIL